MYSRLLWLASLLGLLSAQSIAHSSQENLHMITYNVNNLYDAYDDAGSQDDTYLPLRVKQDKKLLKKCLRIESAFYKQVCQKLDWTQNHYRAKLVNLGNLLEENLANHSADYLVGCFQEVESYTVAEDLVDAIKQSTKFTNLQIDYPISSIPSAGPSTSKQNYSQSRQKSSGNIITLSNLVKLLPTQVINIPIPWSSKRTFRPFLLNYYQLPSERILRVICVHLPSQANHIIYRKVMLRYIFALLDRFSDYVIPTVVLGDFNISSQESIDVSLLPKSLDDHDNEWYQQGSALYWSVHNMGCLACRGTYYFNRNWSWLDSALLSWDLLLPHAHHGLRFHRLALLNKSNVIATKSNFPRRYSLNSQLGLSDHFALWLQFTIH